MNEAIENAISAKCSKKNEPIDFTDEEKEYIRVNYASLTWLFIGLKATFLMVAGQKTITNS